MKVVLLYVGVGVAGLQADRPLGDREGGWIGHGIASIGATLKAHGHGVTLFDLRQFASWDEAFARIAATPADVYGLSIAPIDWQFAVPLATVVKHYHPATRVVVGGIHPTLFPHLYKHECIDTVVLGEGEAELPKLLAELQRGLPWLKRVVAQKPVLDTLPFVDRELFQYERELSCTQAPDHPTPSITMLAGRGCPYQCSYCQPAENAVFGSPYRMRSVPNVIQELLQLQARYSFKSITFWDDTFTLNRRWVLDFCKQYQEAGLVAKIAACSRADLVCQNEDVVASLAAIGLDWLIIGFESGSQRVLDFLRKGTTVAQNLQAAEICRKHGIKVFATYMYGLPTETKAEALMTASMIDKIAPDHDSPFYFVPIPGTAIYQACVEHGLLLDRSSINRTGVFAPAIKGVDYAFLDNLRSEKGRQARQQLREGISQLDRVAQLQAQGG